MKKLLISLFLITGTLALSACGSGEDDTQAAEVIEPINNAIESYGTVQVSSSQHVALEIPGKVTATFIKSGQPVMKGDPLFTLDISDYMDELARKKDSLAMLEEELALMGDPDDETLTDQEASSKKQVEASTLEKDTLYKQYTTLKKAIDHGTDEDIQLAAIQRQTSEKDLTTAQDELVKSEALFNDGIISQDELDLAKRAVSDAEAANTSAKLSYSQTVRMKKQERDTLLQSYRLAESQLSLMTDQLNQTGLQYDAKVIDIDGLRGEIESMEANLASPYLKEDGQVICHIDSGVVDDFHLTTGDYVTGDPTMPVYTLHDLTSLEIYTEVSEDFIKDLQLGQVAEITPVASRDNVYMGTITFISGVAYDQGGEAVIPVRLTIQNDDGFLKANYSVDVSFQMTEEGLAELVTE